MSPPKHSAEVLAASNSASAREEAVVTWIMHDNALRAKNKPQNGALMLYPPWPPSSPGECQGNGIKYLGCACEVV